MSEGQSSTFRCRLLGSRMGEPSFFPLFIPADRGVSASRPGVRAFLVLAPELLRPTIVASISARRLFCSWGRCE